MDGQTVGTADPEGRPRPVVQNGAAVCKNRFWKFPSGRGTPLRFTRTYDGSVRVPRSSSPPFGGCNRHQLHLPAACETTSASMQQVAPLRCLFNLTLLYSKNVRRFRLLAAAGLGTRRQQKKVFSHYIVLKF